MEDDVTVMTCWDADRLDLGRVGMVPEAQYLCTDAAKHDGVLKKANHRSRIWKRSFESARQRSL
jgi:uncharacterized protein